MLVRKTISSSTRISRTERRSTVEEALNKSGPLGRLAETNEIAHAVLFLASSESTFVAGHELFVDGGVAAI